MKKIILLVATLFIVLTLSACTDLCIGTECITGEIQAPNDDLVVTAPDNVIYYDHINGHGEVTVAHDAYVLFEYEMRDYVKYQVTYLSCTCRNPDINYWQVAYVEVNKSTNTIRTISFGPVFDVSTGHDYTPGMWGDSSPTPADKYLEDFENEFIPWLVGKDLSSLDGISVFTNEDYHGILNTKTIDDSVIDVDGTQVDLIDDYAGSSVSTNNMIRIMKSLLEYHEKNY
jgi:hypothetical protein